VDVIQSGAWSMAALASDKILLLAPYGTSGKYPVEFQRGYPSKAQHRKFLDKICVHSSEILCTSLRLHKKSANFHCWVIYREL
jgi:hypothetical protein